LKFEKLLNNSKGK
jgi:hypothetical protein